MLSPQSQKNLNISQTSFLFREQGSLMNNKAAELGSKIGHLHQNQDFSKQEKQTQLDDKLVVLENKVKQQFVSEQEEMAQNYKEQLKLVQEHTENNAEELLNWNEENSILLKQVQQELTENIQKFSKNKKQLDTKMGQNIDEQFYHLSLECQKNNRLYEESRLNKISEVKQNVSLLKDLVLQEKLKREEGFQNINGQIISIIEDLKLKYRQQQKVKESSYNQIFNDINQVNAMLVNEIKNETKEREFVVESLFKTLEEVSSTYGKKYRK